MKKLRIFFSTILVICFMIPLVSSGVSGNWAFAQPAKRQTGDVNPEQLPTATAPSDISNQPQAAAEKSPVNLGVGYQLRSMMQKVSETMVNYFPRAVGALIVLILGWLLAVFLAWIVGGLLRRTKLDKQLSKLTEKNPSKPALNFTGGVAKVLYYLLMLFVVVGVLQVLNLAVLTDPINLLLGSVFEYIPLLVGALALLLVAWLVANLIRFAVTKALSKVKIEAMLTSEDTSAATGETTLNKTIGNVFYWITFLLFLPAILDTLGMDGLLTPVQNMWDKVLVALPNILAAGLIFLVGWVIARMITRLVVNLLKAINTDKTGEKIGIKTSPDKKSLSDFIGVLVFALIIIPVAIATLNALKIEAIALPAMEMLTGIMNAVPAIFAAALVLVVAYVIARLLKSLVSNILNGIGFNNLPVWLGLSDQPVEGEKSPADIAGYVVLVAILLFAVIESLELLGFQRLSELFTSLAAFGGQLILALLVFSIGLYLANLAYRLISSSSTPRARIYAHITRYTIIFLVAAMALREVGIASEIISLAFGIILGTIAVALAIAFGVGSREIAARHVRKWLGEEDSNR